MTRVTEVSRQQLLADLDTVAADRAKVEANRDLLMATTAELVRAGHDAGIPVAELARRAGVARNTIYAMLED